MFSCPLKGRKVGAPYPGYGGTRYSKIFQYIPMWIAKAFTTRDTFMAVSLTQHVPIRGAKVVHRQFLIFVFLGTTYMIHTNLSASCPEWMSTASLFVVYN